MTFWKWTSVAASDDTADATINWQEGQAPSTVNNSARAMMAALAKYRADISGALVASGTATAYTVTTQQTVSSPTPPTGLLVAFTPSITNGNSVTLALDSGSAYPIQNPAGSAVASGTIIRNNPYSFVFNGSAFLQQNVAPAAAQVSDSDNELITARVTSDQVFTSNAVLSSIMSVNVTSGLTYSFLAVIFTTGGGSGGGFNASINGSCSATNIIYNVESIDAAQVVGGGGGLTSLGSSLSLPVGASASGMITIKGTITVNSGGTLQVWFAQATPSGNATTAKAGSYFWVQNIA